MFVAVVVYVTVSIGDSILIPLLLGFALTFMLEPLARVPLWAGVEVIGIIPTSVSQAACFLPWPLLPWIAQGLDSSLVYL